jgi:LmbE family N-acetylglucosaminyl deacetylase
VKKIGLFLNDDTPKTVLCLGAHSDDIEIGCGGTLLRLLSEYENVVVHWVVFGAQGVRKTEAMESAERFLAKSKKTNILIESFKDGFFPYRGEEIKAFFETLKRAVAPDIIFTHYRHDRHQDHRLISELTWNTFRNHLIFEYEIMKYDGDLGNPNFFVHLDHPTCQQKITQLLSTFKSQANHHWFQEDAFWALLRLRGIECNALDNFAEGFHCRKLAI